MSIFGAILSKIFNMSGSPAPAPQPQQPAPAAKAAQPANKPQASAQQTPNPPAQQPAPAAQQPAPAQKVDVEKVLTELASKKGGGGNWRTSIVDLLKLLDLDSSLAARKELAKELNVHAGADGSPEQNIALQKAVWAKLAENGGHVPASLHS